MIDNVIYDSNNKMHCNIKDLYNDKKAIKRFLNMYSTIKQFAITEGNLDILDMCMDIDNVIKEFKFTPLQKERLRLWMLGYKEHEIACMSNVNRTAIHNFLDNISEKISEKLKR